MSPNLGANPPWDEAAKASRELQDASTSLGMEVAPQRAQERREATQLLHSGAPSALGQSLPPPVPSCNWAPAAWGEWGAAARVQAVGADKTVSHQNTTQLWSCSTCFF